MKRKTKPTQRRPRKAMILAAGYGTRMHPLSQDMPKAVMPLWNRSLLARNMDLLRGWGLRDILINAHHGADHVIREACSLSRAGLRITVSHEPEILATSAASTSGSITVGSPATFRALAISFNPLPVIRHTMRSSFSTRFAAANFFRHAHAHAQDGSTNTPECLATSQIASRISSSEAVIACPPDSINAPARSLND